jgi:hypothetical protein
MVDGVKDRIEGFLVIISFSGSTIQRLQKYENNAFSEDIETWQSAGVEPLNR